MSLNQTIELVKKMLEIHNLDLNDPNFVKTPERAGKFFNQFLKGYDPKDVSEIFKSSFPSKNNNMVIIKNIPAFSFCPHHLSPVSMRVWIGYIPKGKVLGLSKFRRLVKLMGQYPYLQEDITEKIADEINVNLEPSGVIVVIEGQHMCMCMRGIEQPDSKVATSAVRGNFKLHEVKAEFLSLINKSNKE